MSGNDWDLRFAVRVGELNARLAKPGALPSGQPLASHQAELGIDITATLKSAQILEVSPGGSRAPGPKPTLTVQMDLADVQASGSGVEKMCRILAAEAKSQLQYDAVTVLFEITLEFVHAQDGGSKLIFDAFQSGPSVVTATFAGSTISPSEQKIMEPLLSGWLTEHLGALLPAFALFGEGGWSLATLSYAYLQAPKEGEDLLCVYAMLSGAGPGPRETAMVPEIVEDGKAAFLLSTSAFMTSALEPALNAFALSIDPATYNGVNGKVFSYDESTLTLALAGVELQSGTVENEGHTNPLLITQLNLRYGNFAGKDALQLLVEQSATLQTDHVHGDPGGVFWATKVDTVDWCTIHRQQSDILDLTVGTGNLPTKGGVIPPRGQRPLNLTSRGGADSTDKSWSEPIDDSTGSPALDIILKILGGASDLPALLFYGPVGIAIFLVKLGITTLAQEIDLNQIEKAKDKSQPVSPDAIIKAVKFEWGGIGDIDYSSAKLDGGLKVIGA